MHELSIAQALVEQLDQIAASEDATVIAALTIEIGSLSGCDPEALKLAFPLAAGSSIAAGAALTIKLTRASATCRACRTTFTPDSPFFVCETCGSMEIDVEGGRDLLIRSVELNVPGDRPPYVF